jgi:hypothetical protein
MYHGLARLSFAPEAVRVYQHRLAGAPWLGYNGGASQARYTKGGRQHTWCHDGKSGSSHRCSTGTGQWPRQSHKEEKL